MEFCLAQKILLHLLFGNTYKLMKTSVFSGYKGGPKTVLIISLFADRRNWLMIKILNAIQSSQASCNTYLYYSAKQESQCLENIILITILLKFRLLQNCLTNHRRKSQKQMQLQLLRGMLAYLRFVETCDPSHPKANQLKYKCAQRKKRLPFKHMGQ